MVGRVFKLFELGPRNYGQHAHHRVFRVANYWWMQFHWIGSVSKPVFSRFFGVQQGPLNYSGMFMFFWFSILIMARFRFIRIRDTLSLNYQDNPEFWYKRYSMMFPPSFLHNRISAHFIEINHIYATEMLKRYQVARKEVLDERERHTDQDKRTRYAMNSNYVYEPLGQDTGAIRGLKDANIF